MKTKQAILFLLGIMSASLNAMDRTILQKVEAESIRIGIALGWGTHADSTPPTPTDNGEKKSFTLASMSSSDLLSLTSCAEDLAEKAHAKRLSDELQNIRTELARIQAEIKTIFCRLRTTPNVEQTKKKILLLEEQKEKLCRTKKQISKDIQQLNKRTRLKEKVKKLKKCIDEGRENQDTVDCYLKLIKRCRCEGITIYSY